MDRPTVHERERLTRLNRRCGFAVNTARQALEDIAYHYQRNTLSTYTPGLRALDALRKLDEIAEGKHDAQID